jgi:hypothetical protein
MIAARMASRRSASRAASGTDSMRANIGIARLTQSGRDRPVWPSATAAGRASECRRTRRSQRRAPRRAAHIPVAFTVSKAGARWPNRSRSLLKCATGSAGCSKRGRLPGLTCRVSASAPGRAFLEQHVRRQPQTETAVLLGASERLEAQIAAHPDMSHELNALVESVRSLLSQIDAMQLASAVTQLAATPDIVHQRLSALISNDVPKPNRERKLVQRAGAHGRPRPAHRRG